MPDMITWPDNAIEELTRVLINAPCICREGVNQYGPWYQINMDCPKCGDSAAKVRTILADLARPGSVVARTIAAQALRDAADEVDRVRRQIETAQLKVHKGYLPILDSGISAGYSQAVGLVRERADRLEKEALDE